VLECELPKRGTGKTRSLLVQILVAASSPKKGTLRNPISKNLKSNRHDSLGKADGEKKDSLGRSETPCKGNREGRGHKKKEHQVHRINLKKGAAGVEGPWGGCDSPGGEGEGKYFLIKCGKV